MPDDDIFERRRRAQIAYAAAIAAVRAADSTKARLIALLRRGVARARLGRVG